MKYDINIKNVNLELLRDQKEALNNLQWKTNKDGSNYLSASEFSAVEGIINLIDHIQDQAVEQHGLSEEYVYKFTEE